MIIVMTRMRSIDLKLTWKMRRKSNLVYYFIIKKIAFDPFLTSLNSEIIFITIYRNS